MRGLKYVAVAILALAVAGCGKKEEESEVVPPGFCKTEAECQPMADRENARQEELRQKRITQGVHEQYLPCGTYKPTKAPNGYWNGTRGAAGCPSRATQQAPHPDLGKAKKSAH